MDIKLVLVTGGSGGGGRFEGTHWCWWSRNKLSHHQQGYPGGRTAIHPQVLVVVVQEVLMKEIIQVKRHGGTGVQLPSTFQDPAQSLGMPGPGGQELGRCGGGGGAPIPDHFMVRVAEIMDRGQVVAMAPNCWFWSWIC